MRHPGWQIPAQVPIASHSTHAIVPWDLCPPHRFEAVTASGSLVSARDRTEVAQGSKHHRFEALTTSGSLVRARDRTEVAQASKHHRFEATSTSGSLVRPRDRTAVASPRTRTSAYTSPLHAPHHLTTRTTEPRPPSRPLHATPARHARYA